MLIIGNINFCFSLFSVGKVNGMTAYDEIIKNRESIFAMARKNGTHDTQGRLVMGKDDPWRSDIDFASTKYDVKKYELEDSEQLSLREKPNPNDISYWFNNVECAVIETDEEKPREIVRITFDGISVSAGYQLRLKPMKE